MLNYATGESGVQSKDPLQIAQREAVEEMGPELSLDTPKLLLARFLHAGPASRPGRIRLDPTEHNTWAVHAPATWHEQIGLRTFTRRLGALERTRCSQGPDYLTTHP